MAEDLRYIVEALNREPFKKSYTVITFDSLDPLNLLQLVNDVLSEIDPDQRIDLREEPPEQTAIRMLSVLRLLNYKPKTDTGEGMNTFRQGLIQGEKLTIYPLLKWLLERTPDLKKRAYLARYLVKIEVPQEHLQDDVVMETYQTYQDMLEHFKELHKAVEYEKSSEYNTADVRRDIESMEQESKQLTRQIERLQRRVEAFPNHEEMVESAQKLRKERAKRIQLEKQKQDQKEKLLQFQQKVQRMSRQLEEVKASTEGLTADKIISRLEEETKVIRLLTEDDLPKKTEVKRKRCLELEKVLLEPVVSELDLEVIQQQIEETNMEIRELMEKRMAGDESSQENMTLFRQQASMIAYKREAAAEKCHLLTEELSEVEKELEKQRKNLDEMGGLALVDEGEFKKCLARMRKIGNEYKTKKVELSKLRAEFGVLSRTEEILKSRDDNVEELLKFLEEREGVTGYRETQDTLEKVSAMKSEVDDKKEETLKEMSKRVEKIKVAIEEKKASLAPLIRDVRPLRQQHQQLLATHSEHKQTYDNLAVGFQTNRVQLEQEVRQLWEECVAEESQYHYLNCMLQSVKLQQQRIANEMKVMVSKDPAEKKKSLRDQFTRKIQEQENLGRALRDKQKEVKENHEYSIKQLKMWKDLQRLFKVKNECFQRIEQQKLQSKALEEMAVEGRLEINT